MTTKTRAVVALQDFLRVTIKERQIFGSVSIDADELGMTPASFKQRLMTEKKLYPKLYANWTPYYSDQRRIPSEEEAEQILASLTS